MRLSLVSFVSAIVALLVTNSLAQDNDGTPVTVKLSTSVTAIARQVTNAQGQSVLVYRGIRYAEAPTGNSRWKPTKLLSFTGTVNASAFGSVCYSDNRYDVVQLFQQSEDCLFLNVYAPPKSSSSSLPVMVFTHGGAWVSGSGNIYDGRNLVGAGGNNVIYVSFNYRLGLFGFLGGQQLLAEGNGANLGLRDMQNAFKWVKANIQQFGGNPNDITAVGTSSGAFMVALQMITDGGNQQLFNKAILQSGGYPSFTQLLPVVQQNDYLQTIAQGAGCLDPKSLLACLRTKDAVSLMALGGNLDWRPIVDNVYLTDVPYTFVANNKVSNIPIMIGTNTDEGYLFMYGVDSNDMVIPTIAAAFPSLTLADFTRVTTLYPVSLFASPQKRAAEILSDLVFVCPSEKLTETLAQSKSPYRYRFDEETWFFGMGPAVATHMAEIPYVFNNDDKIATDANAQVLVGNMQKFWTNFARYANPNGQSRWPSWPKYDLSTKSQIVLQRTLDVERNGAGIPLHADRCAFWNSIEARTASSSSEFMPKSFLAEQHAEERMVEAF